MPYMLTQLNLEYAIHVNINMLTQINLEYAIHVNINKPRICLTC